jgi:arylsulfatase A-like enzyme
LICFPKKLRFVTSRQEQSMFKPSPILLILLLSLVNCSGGDEIGGKDSETVSRPNVVIFLADDQGWGDLSINGNTDLRTPNIDSLARDGARFMNFYVSPVCAPTRAEFLTGRYYQRGGVHGVSRGAERLDLDETTLADLFKEAGYATGAFGKWHNGMQYPYHPNGRGFDEFYGFCSGHWGHYFFPLLEHNGRVVRGQGFSIDDFTDRAMAFMEKNQNRAFLVYLPYNTPHSPMQVPEEYWSRFENKALKKHHPKGPANDHTRCALAMCENIDWNVGRVLKKLEELGLSEKTIVVYFSDNGPNGFRWLDGLRGKKGSTDEGGVKSPLHIRYPQSIQPGTLIGAICSSPDLLPTLTDLANLPRPTHKPLDGMSLLPLLKGKSDHWPERILIQSWQNRYSARSRDYRLDAQGRLYDITRDPGQSEDLSQSKPVVVEQLTKAIEEFKVNVVSELPAKDDRPFIVGHPGTRFTHLPARDGQATGNIKRSSIHPNCSFFTNWSRMDEMIYWDVSIPETGTFRIHLYYTCAEENTGSTVSLKSRDRELKFAISEAHDPPLTGKAEDRFPRTESYVKDWKPLEAGTIELTPGDHRLQLQPRDIPGSQVMDFRLLVLERVSP